MNVVPTKATRRLAERMIADAEEHAGADVALRRLREVYPEQLPALIGVLLTATKQHKKLGRPPRPITYTEAERREAHRRYKRGGERIPWVREGERQYQVMSKRRSRGLGSVA